MVRFESKLSCTSKSLLCQLCRLRWHRGAYWDLGIRAQTQVSRLVQDISQLMVLEAGDPETPLVFGSDGAQNISSSINM